MAIQQERIGHSDMRSAFRTARTARMAIQQERIGHSDMRSAFKTPTGLGGGGGTRSLPGKPIHQGHAQGTGCLRAGLFSKQQPGFWSGHLGMAQLTQHDRALRTRDAGQIAGKGVVSPVSQHREGEGFF